MRTRSLITVALIAVLSGCAFSAVKRPNPGQYLSQVRQQDVVAVTVEEGAAAAKSAIEAMGWEVLTVNPAIGLVRSKARPVTIPNVCDCGTWNGSAVNGTADASILVSMEPQPSSEVAVNVSIECITNFSGQNLYGATTRRETYQCASRGMVEAEFWSMFKKVVAASKK